MKTAITVKTNVPFSLRLIHYQKSDAGRYLES